MSSLSGSWQCSCDSRWVEYILRSGEYFVHFLQRPAIRFRKAKINNWDNKRVDGSIYDVVAVLNRVKTDWSDFGDEEVEYPSCSSGDSTYRGPKVQRSHFGGVEKSQTKKPDL